MAAGNEPLDKVAFPARYPECIAVGAIGLSDWGPKLSLARYFSDLASANPELKGRTPDQAIFHYPRSAYGEGLDLVAPGVGLVVSHPTKPLIDVTGTSFASPLVAGLLAVLLEGEAEYHALPRGPDRPAYAERLLRAACRRSGLPAAREGAGVPRSPQA